MNLSENIDLAFRNSYDVIINDEVAKDYVSNNNGYFIHHPAEPITKSILESMREYFAEVEEYEKCIAILKYMNENFD
tara:strand:+ start:770 stop:1000 length:231 start_codon:yes stop_codon:yes gene_type:complete